MIYDIIINETTINDLIKQNEYIQNKLVNITIEELNENEVICNI